MGGASTCRLVSGMSALLPLGQVHAGRARGPGVLLAFKECNGKAYSSER